jgi:hypothetical protein
VQDVHPFVVAKQHVHAATGPPRLVFEPHEQVHDLANVRPAIENVAGLYEPGIAANPLPALIDQSCGTQNIDEPGARAVDVGHGDDPPRTSLLRTRPGGEDEAGRHDEDEREHTFHVMRDHILA